MWIGGSTPFPLFPSPILFFPLFRRPVPALALLQVSVYVGCHRLSKRVDDFDEMLTSADESELDALQWWGGGKVVDKDARSNSNALDDDDDDDDDEVDDAVEWSKDFDRDSAASPTSPRSHNSSRIRCILVALLVLLVIAGVCAATLLLHQRMQGDDDLWLTRNLEWAHETRDITG